LAAILAARPEAIPASFCFYCRFGYRPNFNMVEAAGVEKSQCFQWFYAIVQNPASSLMIVRF
jgi:hypothetical protein